MSEQVGSNPGLIEEISFLKMRIRELERTEAERKHAENALQNSYVLLKNLVESSKDVVIFAIDRQYRYIFFNENHRQTMKRIWGVDIALGNSMLEYIKDSEDYQKAKTNFDRALSGESFTLVEAYGDTALERRYYEDIYNPIIDGGGEVVGLTLFLTDITDRKLMEKALRDSERKYRELSTVDDLTRLYNSRHFFVQLKIEIDRTNRYNQPLTLLLLDLDNFKAFNDAYGHIEGDKVLRRIGRVIKRCLRETDFAYRYGGEEFTIILPMTTGVDGAVTAERIRAEVKNETFSPVQGQDVHVTASIGFAQYEPREEMHVFIHRVDQLMYQGKKKGKDNVCCELHQQLKE